MLFNSQEFLFAFLPITLLVTALALKRGRSAGILALTGASIFFYGWWEWSNLFVIGVSIGFNYLVAQAIASPQTKARKTALLWFGVAGNLVALGYFKYANFLVDTLEPLFGGDASALSIVLPLAISFYSFQQIAFLVDTYNGKVDHIPLRRYLISVVFFPHLIAGPLLHYGDIIAQFEKRFAVNWSNISVGLPIFAMGLAKKVAIADPIAQFVSPLFDRASAGPLPLLEAWAASLGYTAQLYFDFSGYSDMAIGLGLMFGIVLPINFLSPYKATSIIEFWRRWHITLSNFLRDYLYIPLGGSRVQPIRRYFNLIIVMILGGLWHGAGWTFVFWGFLHGAYLVVNHLWRNNVSPFLGGMERNFLPVYGAVTFLLVVVAWVFFRSPTFEVALNVLTGMFLPQSVALPGELSVNAMLAALPGIRWGGGMTYADFMAFWTFALGAFALIWLAPNTVQIFGLAGQGQYKADRPPRPRAMRWGAVAMLLWISAFGVFSAVPSEFLYFQF